MVLAGVFGAIVGLAVGLLGAGGSILAIPALVYGVGQPLDTAIPTSLAVVAVSSIGGILPAERRERVQWRIALVFAAAGVPAAVGGTALGGLIPQRWLLLAFAALMVVVAVRMLRGSRRSPAGACRTGEGRIDWRRCLPRAIAAGAAVGALTGLFGVGGGFVIVPALSVLLGLEAQVAVATSLLVVLINSVGGFAAHASTAGNIDYVVLLVFAGAALVISLLAGRIAPRLPAHTLQRAFGGVVLVVAVGVAVAAIVNPSLFA